MVARIVVKSWTKEGWQCRSRLDLEAVLTTDRTLPAKIEENCGIQLAYNYWSSLKRRRGVREDSFNVLNVAREGAAVKKIDVSMENPIHYLFREQRAPLYASMEGKPLCEFPYKDIVHSCATEYALAKGSREPIAYHISHDLNGFRREYNRMILPLVNRRNRVTALVCVSCHLTPPYHPGPAL